MKTIINNIVFKNLMKELDIEVIEPEIVTPETRVEDFYSWLVKCGNIYLNNNEMVVSAFHKIANF